MERAVMAEEKELQVQDAEKQEIVESGAERTRDKPAFVPRVDILENNDEIVVVADMPGVSAESVDITLEQDRLTIDGYVEPAQYEGYTLAYAEYRVGDFQRSFTLSNKIDRDKIEATMNNGVLRLRLPKIGPTTTRIAVKAG
jgi:HSP20 family molecular chaperone IbpA